METFKQVISMGRDKLMSGIKFVYSDINPSTLTGAIDVIVVEQPDGSFTCGPFHVRFGKMGTLKPADKIVDIHLNGRLLEHLHMKLGSAGEAYFLETIEDSLSESLDSSLVVSPFHSDAEATEEQLAADLSNNRLPKKRLRRNPRHRADHFVKSNHDDDSNPAAGAAEMPTYLSDNDDFVLDNGTEARESIDRHGGYSSDGAVDQIPADELTDINMTWDWGNFPLDGRAASSGLVDGNNGRDSPVKHDTPSKEIYLEDIIDRDVSDELKRTYLYGERQAANRSDANATTGIDAGYRSDGENSQTAVSPTYPVIHELKLSLCGDIALNDKITEETFFQYLVSFEDFIRDPDELLKNSNLVLLLNGTYYNWSVAAPIILSIIAFQTELPLTTVSSLKSTHMSQKKRRSTWFSWRRQDPSPDQSRAKPADPEPEPEPKPSLPTDSVEDDTATRSGAINNKLYVKKIRLSSAEVAALDLNQGRNEIVFSMTTKYQGTTSCRATIYRWNWFDKIVISDVDGTITKSDVLGHVLPILGRDWTQAGVVRLYNKIYQNNYRFIYLSARAIGQATSTRNFLSDVVRQSADKLPEGPILLSPTSLFQSLHREVIEKKPEHFKIQCLNDVRALFPDSAHPLYAGFGNRTNDVIAYKGVGIDPKRIFTVNPEGSLKNEYCQKWSTSYGNLFEVADHFFQFRPTTHDDPRRAEIDYAHEDYIDLNYWATPIDEADIRDEINKSKAFK